RASPEVGGGLDADHADRATLQILHGADRPVVLGHVGRAEPLLAGGLQAHACHDLHVDALGAREDHRETGSGAGIELTGEIRLEALGIGLEGDLLELVTRALIGREVRARAHQQTCSSAAKPRPKRISGGSAACAPTTVCAPSMKIRETNQTMRFTGTAPLRRSRFRAFASIPTGCAAPRGPGRAPGRASR